jgi:peptidoglycan/LPS O-acetylase OafA/YrhL
VLGVLRRGFSNYCDVLRFSAAFAVLLSHVSTHSLSGGFLYQLQRIGHPSVIVFFVLSGYVISYVVSSKEKTLADYATSRLARLLFGPYPGNCLDLCRRHDRHGAQPGGL